MPKRKVDSEKLLKSVGMMDMKKNGNQIELLFDPAKMPAKVRNTIAPGLTGATANTLYQNPFDSTFFNQPYTSLSQSPHEKIKLAMMYFNTDPLVGKIIELMKIFSNDGFKNECSDPEIKRWYDNWADMVDLKLILSWMFLEYYRSGNVVTSRVLMTYKEDKFGLDSPEYGHGSVKPEDLKEAEAAAKKMYSKKSIPIAYTVLNPLTIFVSNVNAYQDSLFVKADLPVPSNSENDAYSLIIKEMPKNLGEIAKKAGLQPLSDKNTRRILRMRQPYEPYGSVLMERAFNAIYEKNKLRQMDMSMVNSAINQIIKVTVGNDDYPATQKQIKNLATAFQNAGKGQAIFWNHTLQIEVIKPDTSVLNNQKYDRVNEDIRNAFGISEILTGGGSSKTNFATAYLSLKAFMANLMEGRNDILRWLDGEYKDIAKAMGFKTYPTPSFNPLSLTDEIAEKQIIMQLVDRGIISYESAQSRLGYDPRIERDRREKELPDIKEGILGFAGNPFQQEKIGSEIVDTDEESDENVKKEDKKDPDTRDEKAVQANRRPNKSGNPKKAQIKGSEGRPKTPRGQYPEKRKTAKIKGQGSIIDGEISTLDERFEEELTEE